MDEVEKDALRFDESFIAEVDRNSERIADYYIDKHQLTTPEKRDELVKVLKLFGLLTCDRLNKFNVKEIKTALDESADGAVRIEVPGMRDSTIGAVVRR